jgi:hypothetical protein
LKWQTVPHPQLRGTTRWLRQRMLARKPDGSCVYLGASGCTTQHDKPEACAEADCRDIARAWKELSAASQRAVPVAVFRRGRELLRA